MVKNFLKSILPLWAIELVRWRRDRLSIIVDAESLCDRTCPCCGFRGAFRSFGRPRRIDALCPNCGSLERHRLFVLALRAGSFGEYEDDISYPILHFAAERPIEMLLRNDQYFSADLFEISCDLSLDIEKMDIENERFGAVIANHVLEHVDDKVAVREVHRVLKENGLFICMVPIVEGWESTYEPNDLGSDEDRLIHFGQSDHLRYFGRDFRTRVASCGFSLVCEHTAEGKDVVRYGLQRGEKVFVFRKVEI